MMIYKVKNGDEIHKYNRCLVAKFEGRRKVLSTSMHNGGYKENLTAVFNHDVNPGIGMKCEYCKSSDEEKRKFIVDELGLEYDKVAYMATIVSMDSAVIKTLTYDEITVTAIATASLEVNAGRVGEEATCYEQRGESINLKPGTINIMVFCNADMTPGCMARAIMTATEAKTAALQELIASSLRTSGIATGSGTDNIMIIANSESNNTLTYAGKHGKLGELIGRTVIDAVKEALEKHMGLSVDSQHSMLARIKRYGIAEKSFCEQIKLLSNQYNNADILNQIHILDKDGIIVALTSLYIHLLDQLQWKLISEEEALRCGIILLRQISAHLGVEFSSENISSGDINIMLDLFTACISNAVINNLHK